VLYTDLLERALAYAGGTHTLDDVLAGIASGEFQAWPGERSILLTKIMAHPQLLEACCFLAAGDMDEIQQLYPVMLEWAKAKGCQRASFMGRPGWQRTFLTKDEGWTSRLVVYEKELV
jgi:hypothetical protein